ncbi:MAG: ribulose-phosphate 3-epimerase [Bacteroidetes bacterium]|nr:ribulose-phosphate 3-epimerase [Bacteroidota bacterium]
MHKIAPSILSADFGNLQRDIEMINASDADWFHVDVMDGVFVPNISFGFPVMKALQKHAQKPLDVHLMIVQPERYFQEFKDAGAEVLTIHYEASTHLHRSIHAIKDLGMKAGVALNPHTPVSLLEDTLADIDLVILMSVNPGFGGQKFIQNTYKKVQQLKALREKVGSDTLIEIDGGVSTSNAAELVKTGADVLVAGNAVFASGDPKATIQQLKQSS